MAENTNIDIEEKFQKAAGHIQGIAANLDATKLLELYGLYKQATCGPNNTQQPSWFNVTAKRKWESWKNLGDISKVESMKQYIVLVNTLDPDWEDEDEEIADGGAKDAFSNWMSVSCPVFEPEEAISDADKTLLDWAKEGVIAKVRELAVSQDVNQWDEEGMTSLHWAADRGNTEMLDCLLSLGADVNFQDSEGQTALHYASSCGHIPAVQSLLLHHADVTLVDKEGDSPADVAASPEISKLMHAANH
jgi:acyl-CoA-binding protein